MPTLDDAYLESRIASRVRFEPPDPSEQVALGDENVRIRDAITKGTAPQSPQDGAGMPSEPPATTEAAPQPQAPDGQSAAATDAKKGGGLLGWLSGTARRMTEDFALALSGQSAPPNPSAGAAIAPEADQQAWLELGKNPNENLYAVQRDPADGALKLFVRDQPLTERDRAQRVEDTLADVGRVLASGMLDPVGGAGVATGTAARLASGAQGARSTVSAGPAGEILRRMGQTARKADVPIIEGDDLTKTVRNYVAVREASDAEIAAFRAINGATEGKPPVLQFNLDRINGPDDVKATIDAAGQVFNTPKTVTFDEIKQQAAQAGVDEKFLARVLQRGDGGELLNAPEMYNAMRTLTASGAELDRLARVVVSPNATDAEKLLFRQQLAFHGALSQSIKGIQSDVARTLAAFRIPRDAGDAQAGDAVRQILSEFGGDQSVTDLAKKYLTLNTQSARNQIAERGMLARASDAFLSVYINGLLSAPKTHVVNMVGSALFGGMKIAERQIAAGVGAVRTALPNSDPERAAMGEAAAMMQGAINGFLDGLSLGRRAFVENMPISDTASRIEIMRGDRLNAISGDAFNLTGPVGNAVDYLGKAITLPGRALLAEDEFFKAVGYRMELHAQAYRKGGEMFNDLVGQGVPVDQAKIQASQWAADFIDNPPPNVTTAARDFAKTMTFQRDLQSPLLQDMQKWISAHPAAKVIVPFFKTPVNIMSETLQRTPLAPLSQRFREDFAAGGVRRDLAISKVTLGSMVMATAASFAADGRLTGSGPAKPELRQALERQGWQAHSIVYNRGELTDESIAQLQKYGAVKVGPEKVYVSYERFDPISPLLAMAADMTEFAARSEDEASIDALASGAALSFYEYMGDQPFFTGLQKVGRLFQSMYDEPEERFGALAEGFAETYGGALLGGVPYSSLRATLERISDPRMSNIMPEDFNPTLGPAVRGWYKALQGFKSRDPFLSDEVEPGLDLFGRIRTQGQGSILELVSPVRVSPGKESPADQVLLDAGMPLRMPQKKMDGVPLSAPQYNRLIELTNTLRVADGKTFSEYVAWLGDQPEYKELPQGEGSSELGFAGKQGVLGKVYSSYQEAARQVLLQEEPELAAVLAAKKRERALYGR